jgi:hypothetical protein
MDPNDYLASRLEPQIQWHSRAAAKNKLAHASIRSVEILCAALIPFLTGHQAGNTHVAVVIGLLGTTIAVLAGTASIFQLEQRWTEYRTTAEALKREKFLYSTGSGPYHAKDSDFQMLVERIENILTAQNVTWASSRTEHAKAHAPA